MSIEPHIDLQPELSGKRIKLEPINETHKETVFAAASDPKIWEQHPDHYTPWLPLVMQRVA